LSESSDGSSTTLINKTQLSIVMAVVVCVLALVVGSAVIYVRRRQSRAVQIINISNDPEVGPAVLNSGVVPITEAFLDEGRADFHLKLKAMKRSGGVEVTAYKKKNPLFRKWTRDSRATDVSSDTASTQSVHDFHDKYGFKRHDTVNVRHADAMADPPAALTHTLGDLGRISAKDLLEWEPHVNSDQYEAVAYNVTATHDSANVESHRNTKTVRRKSAAGATPLADGGGMKRKASILIGPQDPLDETL